MVSRCFRSHLAFFIILTAPVISSESGTVVHSLSIHSLTQSKAREALLIDFQLLLVLGTGNKLGGILSRL